ncbi:hypothetical protein [Streptomyces sp. NPDC054887]
MAIEYEEMDYAVPGSWRVRADQGRGSPLLGEGAQIPAHNLLQVGGRMEFFPIAALVIATFLLLIGIVGRGASMGSSQFHVTLEGTIGRLPRAAILAVSIVTYILAIFLFVYVAESKSSSGPPSPPATTQAETPPSTITLKIESLLPDGYTAEKDTIIIGDSEPLVLEMDSNGKSMNGAVYLDAQLDGASVRFSVDVMVTKADGTEEAYSGEGVITAGDGLAYSVILYEDGTAGLEPS